VTDEATCRQIDKVVDRALEDAGLKEPPFMIEDLLEYLEVNRDFYDLEDVRLLRRFWHKVKVRGRRLVNIARKISLHAVWLPDDDQILVDSSIPAPKQEWASFHDAVHTIVEWHRPYFLGDTAQTLDPDFQEMLEGEANYGASALMFGGKIFAKEALDTSPEWASIQLLKKRYKKSYVTTVRRYVQFSHDIPMVIVISTPWWEEKPDDQKDRCRHFVPSRKFGSLFACISPEIVLEQVDNNTYQRTGGPVGQFGLSLPDINGDLNEFYAESFYNRHYVLTLLVYQGKLKYF